MPYIHLPSRWLRQPGPAARPRESLLDTLRFGYAPFLAVPEWCPEDMGGRTESGTVAHGTFAGRRVLNVGGTTNPNTASVTWADRAAFDLPGTGWTMALVARRTVAPGTGYDRLFHRNVDNSGTDRYGFLNQPSSANNGAPYAFCNSANVGDISGQPAMSTTELESLVLTHDGTNATFYRKGRFIAAAALSNPTAAANALRLGDSTVAGADGAPFDTEMAFIDGRCWLPEEIAEWNLNRYLLFQQDTARIYSFPAAAGGTVTGTASITEAADTVASAGAVAVTGASAVTEGADTASGSGAVAVSGSSAITEGADTAASAGSVAVVGSSSITEGADAVAASGAVAVAGSANITESADTVAASGTVASGPVGAALITEANDTASAAGTVAVAGAAAISEAADTAASAGAVAVVGTAAITEGDDALDASGTNGDAPPLTARDLSGGADLRNPEHPYWRRRQEAPEPAEPAQDAVAPATATKPRRAPKPAAQQPERTGADIARALLTVPPPEFTPAKLAPADAADDGLLLAEEALLFELID